MGQINLVIADRDTAYLEKLSDYIVGKEPDIFSVTCCTSSESLVGKLNNETKRTDLLLVDEGIYTELGSILGNENDPRQLSQPVLTLLLTEGNLTSEPCVLSSGLSQPYPELSFLTSGNCQLPSKLSCLPHAGCIFKYRHAGRIVSDLISQYSKISGNVSLNLMPKSSAKAKIAAVFSAAGGIGKSTFAVCLGVQCAKMGKSVLYVSFEEAASTRHFFDNANGGNVNDGNLSNLLYALKDECISMDAAMLTAAANSPIEGLCFIPPLDSALEFAELETEEISKLMKHLQNQSKFDIIVLDLGSGLNRLNTKILEECGKAFLLLGSSSLHLAKQAELEREIRFSPCNKEFTEEFAGKLVPLNCRFGGTGTSSSEVNFMGKRTEDFLPYYPLPDEKNVIDALSSTSSSYSIRVAKLAASHLIRKSSEVETGGSIYAG